MDGSANAGTVFDMDACRAEEPNMVLILNYFTQPGFAERSTINRTLETQPSFHMFLNGCLVTTDRQKPEKVSKALVYCSHKVEKHKPWANPEPCRLCTQNGTSYHSKSIHMIRFIHSGSVRDGFTDVNFHYPIRRSWESYY